MGFVCSLFGIRSRSHQTSSALIFAGMPYHPSFLLVERTTGTAVRVVCRLSSSVGHFRREAEVALGGRLFRLTFADERLEDEGTLSDYNIPDGATVHCSFLEVVRRRPAARNRSR